MRRRSSLFIGAGGLILLVGAVITLEPWFEALRWRDSPVAVQAARNAAAPQIVRPQSTPSAATAQPTSGPAFGPAPGTAPAPMERASGTPPTPLPVPVTNAPGGELSIAPTTGVPTPTLGPAELQLTDAAFQFQDPPQPGANVRLSVAIHNPTDRPGGLVSLDLPLGWLDGYQIRGVNPLPANNNIDGQRVERNLRFTFVGPAAGDDLLIAVDLVTVDEVIDAPNLRVVDDQGREIGHMQPPTEAPPSEPGPIYAIDIPRLHLHTGVVQVDWEPPLFVVGQLRASAHVTEGNSVLVGHVRGAAGYNVFDHLDQLNIGDRVVASSRGQTYEFVVSQTQVLPEADTSPTEPGGASRLTLMTCAGDWNPLTRDYSERLWVVAEPVHVAPAPTAATASVAVAAQPTPAQIARRGGPGAGSTDTDLADGFGPPVGESATRLAVYRHNGVEYRAQLVDLPSGLTRRATLVAEHAPPSAALTLEQAVQHSRALFPKDALPRSQGPEGNDRFVVERFSSAALASTLPPDWFTARQAQPGDFLVVYARRPDGRVTDVLVGVGDDPSTLLATVDHR